MNICFITLGCRLNKAESCFWKMLLIKFGYNIVNSIRRANLSIINSCSVTNEASRKTNQTIKRLKKINRNIKIIITGCCVNINYDRLIQFKELNIILNNSKKKFLIKIILKNFPLNSKKKFKKIFYKFFLKIQDGCNNKCTFCVVRIARGKERSFSIKNIINKIKYFEQFGTKEIVLSGIHLGSYGKDLNNNLNLLINEMLEKTNISRIRLGSIEPWNITDRFLNLWKNKRMMPHLHLPLQSGSNSILKKMSRRCMKTYYCDLITEARKRIKDLNITTDVIVGFPGEKNQFFIESIIFIKKIFFGKIHIFPYSKKKETLSYFFKNTISLKKKKNRTFFLKKISDKMEFFFKKKQNNKITNILIESIIKKNNKYIASGYTENFIKISSPVSSMFFLNKIIKTKLLFKFNKIYFKKYCINNN